MDELRAQVATLTKDRDTSLAAHVALAAAVREYLRAVDEPTWDDRSLVALDTARTAVLALAAGTGWPVVELVAPGAQTSEERLAQVISDRDYWREQATGMAPSVDGMRALCTRLFPGGTGCVVDPERVVAEVDSMLAAFDRIDTEASKRAGEYAESVYGVAALRMIGQDNAQDTDDLARLHALVACEPQAADLHDHTACVIAEVTRLRERVLDAEAEASRWGDALVAIGEAIGMPGRGSAEIVEGVRNLTSLLADIRHAMSEEFNPLDDKPPHVQITAKWARAWAAELERLVTP